MATKIPQKPKVTRKSGAKAKSVGGSRGGTKHVDGLSRQEKKTASAPKGGHGTVSSTNKMPVIEYPQEGKNKHPFGKDVKIVGHGG